MAETVFAGGCESGRRLTSNVQARERMTHLGDVQATRLAVEGGLRVVPTMIPSLSIRMELDSATSRGEVVTGVATVKVATVRDFRDRATEWLRSEDVVLVTRDGQPAGFWVPWDEPDALPDELRSAVFQRLSSMVREQLRAAGASEEDIRGDFEASRRSRRRR